MKNIILFTLLFSTFTVFAKQYNIVDFGAKNDSTVLSTTAVQAAIEACVANGGGQVYVPAGQYAIGTVVLKSGVDLHLESGATLLGSRNLDDYTKIQSAYISLRTQTPTVQLIYAENAENISITGRGTIDGRGSGFPKLSWNDEGITRPHLLRMISCRNILVENVSLRNSGCWMQHYLACEELRISGVRVFNRNNFNNDALDLDGCRNVVVSDFIADSDDDGITLKSTSPRPCENISITNCVVSSRCNAVKLGTETNGGFRNIRISGIVVKPSTVQAKEFFGRVGGSSALSLEIVDGGTMENVQVSDMLIDGTEVPVFVRLGNRARSYREGLKIENVGAIRGVSISNIRARNAGKTGCSITGLPMFPVEDITLSNIVIEQSGGGTAADAKSHPAELAADYPEATMFGTLPAYGFYIRHAKNIVFDGVKITTANEDSRPVFVLEDTENVKNDN
ncbi:MAG: glycoside hydrolase [Paludibacter sp.]|jgi:polygalacturonase|nr:glycoside hydrolase [Paludibacter sp.]